MVKEVLDQYFLFMGASIYRVANMDEPKKRTMVRNSWTKRCLFIGKEDTFTALLYQTYTWSILNNQHRLKIIVIIYRMLLTVS